MKSFEKYFFIFALICVFAGSMHFMSKKGNIHTEDWDIDKMSEPIYTNRSVQNSSPMPLPVMTSQKEEEQNKDLKQKWELLTVQFQNVNKCFSSEDCGFKASTPLDYRAEVTNRLIQIIQDFYGVAVSYQERTGLVPQEVGDVARYFMQSKSDEVREEAIQLLNMVPISFTNMLAIIDVLQETNNAALYEAGLSELKRYAGDTQAGDIESFLINSLTQKGDLVRQVVAQNVYPFITENNVNRFQQLTSKNFEKRSTEYRALRSALDEFSRNN